MDDQLRPNESIGATGPTGRPTSGPNIDWDAGLDVTGGDAELLLELAEASQEELPNRMRELRTAYETGDAKLLYLSVHTIKSALFNIGARETASLATVMLDMLRDEVHDGFADRIAELEVHMTQIEQKVAQYVLERRQS